ncbi:major facilitator superfamily domain-containing protein [Xylariales sp. PMI_506]|nr:major facilitator superfamily domain-containing protein [Xylariales sp. PMI_506]
MAPQQDDLESSRVATRPTASRLSSMSLAKVEAQETDALPPTDFGLIPWLQVLGGFFLMFNSWGVLVSYGTFQTYYAAGAISDESSASVIAWIGSLQSFLTLFGGAFTGKLFDAGYFRPMLVLGTFMEVFGLMMVSLSSKFYQFMLAQAVAVGGGMALFTVASMGIPTTWFTVHRGLAVGIVSSGSSIAGIIYPIMLRELISRVGFPWAVRSMAFLVLGTQLVAIAVTRMRLPPRRGGTLIEYKALKEAPFAFSTVGFFVTFLGFFTFYTYVEEWTQSSHIDTKGLDPFYILPIVNASSAFGRIFPGLLCDFIGPMNVEIPSIIMCGILNLVWLSVDTIGPLMVVSILYGFFSGTVVAMSPTLFASLTPDMNQFGGRVAINLIVNGLGSLLGSPISGSIIQSQQGSYDGARIWAGIILIAGASFIAVARFIKTGFSLFTKA